MILNIFFRNAKNPFLREHFSRSGNGENTPEAEKIPEAGKTPGRSGKSPRNIKIPIGSAKKIATQNFYDSAGSDINTLRYMLLVVIIFSCK